MTQAPKGQGAYGASAIADLLSNTDHAVQKSDLMLEIIKSELESTKAAHRKTVHGMDEILGYYRSIREQMTPEEKQEFFKAMLGVLSQWDEARRETLRSIVRRHIQRIHESKQGGDSA